MLGKSLRDSVFCLLGLLFSTHAFAAPRVLVLVEENEPSAARQEATTFLLENKVALVPENGIPELKIDVLDTETQNRLLHLEALRQSAEERFLDFDFAGAEKNYLQARDIGETFFAYRGAIENLIRIYVKLGEVYGQQERFDLRDVELTKALVLRPQRKLDKAEFAPQFIADFEKVRFDLAHRGYAILNIKSVPEGAKVNLNGQHLCETPCVLNSVLAGFHFLNIEAPGFRPHWQRIEIANGTMLPLNLSLERDAQEAEELLRVADLRRDAKAPVQERLLVLMQKHQVDFVIRLYAQRIEIFQTDMAQWQSELVGTGPERWESLLERLTYVKVDAPKDAPATPWYGHWSIPLGVGLGVLGASVGTYFLMQEPGDVIHGDIHP
jgi:hypothetical protein